MTAPRYTDRVYADPGYAITVNGKDITPVVDARLMSLVLAESRGDEADQLDLELDDADGRLELPPKGGEITLALGWVGEGLVDKGRFEVDEIEHSGTPDRVSIRARSAEMRRELRTRAERSYHETTVGQIVADIAARNDMISRVDEKLAHIKVPHMDQTGESDLHFLTRLAKLHDAVATVKKGRLVFLPIGATRTSTGALLPEMVITRADGDQHRYHTAERHSYTGVRAYWHDPVTAQKRSVLMGEEQNEKRLKDTYGSERDALHAARSEMQRIKRGKATMELTLALGRPATQPQTRIRLKGWKPDIDDTPWLAVKLTHTLAGQGLITRMEMETNAEDEAEVPEE